MEKNIPFEFHDLIRPGVSAEKISGWENTAGYLQVLDTGRTAFKKLAPKVKAAIKGGPETLKLLLGEPRLIRRPVLETADVLLLGFDEAAYVKALL